MKRQRSRGAATGASPGAGQKCGQAAWLSSAALLQVNQTFEELALLRDLHELWGVLGPQIFNFMNDSTNVAMLQVGRDGSGPYLDCGM